MDVSGITHNAFEFLYPWHKPTNLHRCVTGKFVSSHVATFEQQQLSLQCPVGLGRVKVTIFKHCWIVAFKGHNLWAKEGEMEEGYCNLSTKKSNWLWICPIWEHFPGVKFPALMGCKVCVVLCTISHTWPIIYDLQVVGQIEATSIDLGAAAA